MIIHGVFISQDGEDGDGEDTTDGVIVMDGVAISVIIQLFIQLRLDGDMEHM